MSSTLAASHIGRGLTTAILSAILVVACGGTAASSAPASVAPTTQATASVSPSPSSSTPTASLAASPAPSSSLATTGRIVDSANGYAITLPEGWVRLDLSDTDLANIMQAAASMSPELAQAMSGQIQTMLSSGLVLFALDSAKTTANVNVLKLSSAGMTLDLLQQLNESQLKGSGIGADLVSEKVTLPAGDAVHFAYSIAASTGKVEIEQYLLVSGTDQYIVSITGTDAATSKAIADSLSFQ